MAGLILSNRNNGLFRDPFGALARDFFSWEPEAAKASVAPFNPLVSVTETIDAFVAEADLPGVREEDVEVTLDGRQLTITGKREAREERDEDRVHVIERRFGSFTRSFTLPETIDGENVKAQLADGVLTVTVPKTVEVLPRKIPVATNK